MTGSGVSTSVLAQALGISRAGVIKRAERERWAYRQAKGGKLWDFANLPREVQIRLSSETGRERETEEPVVFKAVGEKSRERARDRMALLSIYRASGLRVEDFVIAYNTGDLSPALFGKLGPVSTANFYRWIKAWREDGADGIVPKWGLSVKGRGILTDLERGYLSFWYLDPVRRSVAHCWNLLRHNIPDSEASYPAAMRYLRSLPKPLVDFHRLGKTRFDSLYQPYIDRDPSLYAPMDQVVSDHHCFDFVVVRDGKLFRPWITTVQDYSTGKILGFCPSVYPSSLSILAAFYLMVTRFGAARMIHIDNGKDYRSRILNGATGRVRIVNEHGIEEEELIHLHGAFALLGSVVTFSRPYHGQSKGRMERSFGSIAEYFSKETGTYLGSNTVTRLEEAALIYRAINKQAKRLDIFRWEDFVQAFGAFVAWWNANWRGEGKGLGGMTPDEAFAARSGEPRRVDPETLALALTKPEIRRVKENGVTVGGVDYWAPELFEYSGRDVVVRVPLGKQDEVVVMDPKGRVICTAAANWFAETGNLAADNRKVTAARKANMEAVARWGSCRVTPPEGGRNFIEIAQKSYGGEEIDSPQSIAADQDRLDLAAGAEHDPEPKSARRYKSPLED